MEFLFPERNGRTAGLGVCNATEAKKNLIKKRTVIQSNLLKGRATLILSVLYQILSVFPRYGESILKARRARNTKPWT
jgi:hypothetical protein